VSDADEHFREKEKIRKLYPAYDDEVMEALQNYFRIDEEEYHKLLRYIKDNKSTQDIPPDGRPIHRKS
jgi:hypothetical protein